MRVLVVSKLGCHQCDMAKALLEEEDIPFEVEVMDGTKEERQAFLDSCRDTTFPQIFVDGKRLGGYANLVAAHHLFMEKRELALDGDC